MEPTGAARDPHGQPGRVDGLRGVPGPTPALGCDAFPWLKAGRRLRTLIRRRVPENAGWHFCRRGEAEAASAIIMHSNLPAGDKSLDWARARIDRLVGGAQGYDLLASDCALPAFARARPDLLDRNKLRPQLS